MTKIIRRHKAIVTGDRLIISGLGGFKGKELLVTIEKYTKKRTDNQNRALHLWFTQLAEALNSAGFDMRKVIRKEVDISWSPLSVKNYLWRPIQKELFQKKSTTQLTTEEINQIYDNVNRIISERTGVSVPFPNIELLFSRE